MTDAVYEELKKRGTKFSAIALGNHFRMYSGVMLYKVRRKFRAAIKLPCVCQRDTRVLGLYNKSSDS